MENAASKLLATPDPSVGALEAWFNSRTGANGTVSVAGTVVRQGSTCQVVNYATTLRDGQHRDALQHQDALVIWCKTSSGWRRG